MKKTLLLFSLYALSNNAAEDMRKLRKLKLHWFDSIRDISQPCPKKDHGTLTINIPTFILYGSLTKTARSAMRQQNGELYYKDDDNTMNLVGGDDKTVIDFSKLSDKELNQFGEQLYFVIAPSNSDE